MESRQATDSPPMRPDVAERYPDVAEHGSLRLAIAAVARDRGAVLGPISTPSGYERAGPWKVAQIKAGDQSFFASLKSSKRYFSVKVTRPVRLSASGGTTSLAEVVDVAAAWCARITVRDLLERFPFMSADGLVLAFEEGTHLEYRWNRLIAIEAEYLHLRPLLHAAYANDRLRRLFPSTTHDEMLRLTIDALDDQAGWITITRLASGAFQAEASWWDGEFTGSLDEAVHEAAALVAGNPRKPDGA